MSMALVDIAPGINDANHRPAMPVFLVITHLPHTGPVPECAKVLHAEPSVRSEFFRLFTLCHVVFSPLGYFGAYTPPGIIGANLTLHSQDFTSQSQPSIYRPKYNANVFQGLLWPCLGHTFDRICELNHLCVSRVPVSNSRHSTIDCL